MINRYSSRLQQLDEAFLNKKLKSAKSYDRIAGYFCSSILEVAGESIESVSGTVRVICNSGLSPDDVKVAVHAQKLKQEWCEFEPEEKYSSPQSMERLERLYLLIKSGKLQIRVIPDEVYGLMHGKAGIIHYEDGTATSFIGSINETKSAFKLNYEMIWEDDSPEAIDWVQKEFEFFWNNTCAVELSDFVVKDIERLSRRRVIPLKNWREDGNADIPAVAVEEPVFRREFGLWEHQKYFVELAFKEHKTKGGARFVLADQVGLGKTIQLAMSAKLMALYGDKPILIIVPKTLIFQWQEEMKDLLDMPSAVWTGKGWQDETGYFYQAESINSILKCPRRIGIISQGLVARKSDARDKLLQNEYECVICDESHRARRRNPNKDPDLNKNVDKNNLLDFLNCISSKTVSMLLATATPVQVNLIEAYDLLNALSIPTDKVLGNRNSSWQMKPLRMLKMICHDTETPMPQVDTVEAWDIMRNPFPPRSLKAKNIITIRDALEIPDDQFFINIDYSSLQKTRRAIQRKINDLYESDEFIYNYNPYIRHIIRRTRSFLEDTINPNTGEPFLKKIIVQLEGESDKDALELSGYMKDAYRYAEQFCKMLSERVKGGGFMSTLVLKRIGSTIIAGEKTAKKMLAWTNEGREILADEFDEDYDDDSVEQQSELKELTSEELECLKKLVKVLSCNRDEDPKYKKLVEILKNGTENDNISWAKRGCIIFSQYYDSAHFVAEKLSRDFKDTKIALYAGGDKSGYFLNGEYTKELKDEIKRKVKNREYRILVGTDAASEGLNLQTLSSLINLDLPWNPTRLEQRKGRIQRIGQISDKVYIFNMRYKDSVEDKVHERLSSRLEDIHSLFGQIPDTLEDVWIQIAMDNENRAKEIINDISKKNPFTLKYETIPPITDDWESCITVLDKSDKMNQLTQGW